MLRFTAIILTCLCLGMGYGQGTLEQIAKRGELRCGVSDLAPGEPVKLTDGGLIGFYASFCQALAAAVLGDRNAVLYIPASPANQFRLLQAGEVDLLVGSITVTSSRDAEVAFGPFIFREGRQAYAPAVREGDDAWLDAVTWTLYALIQAEEWGITSANIDAAAQELGRVRALQRFIGAEEEEVVRLGLEPDALRRAVRQVGNYAEIYERHLGAGAAVQNSRGPNRLWNEGGLLYAPPFSAR